MLLKWDLEWGIWPARLRFTRTARRLAGNRSPAPSFGAERLHDSPGPRSTPTSARREQLDTEKEAAPIQAE